MIGQVIQTAIIGTTPSRYDRIATHIGDCLETYAFVPSQGGPFPAIVHYTPYQIGGIAPNGAILASGIAMVYVTNRGQGSSCEAPDLFGKTAQADLLVIDQWLSDQPWSLGTYCLQGHSGPGFMGTLSSALRPPGLKCAFLGGADTKLWEGVVTKSGAWWPLAPMWVIQTYGKAALQEPETRIPALIENLVAVHTFTRDLSFFNERDQTLALRSIDVPILFETSWDDLAWGAEPLGGPYLDLVQNMAHPGSAVIIYPGPHPSFDPSNERPFRAAFNQGTAYPREIRDFIVRYLRDDPAPSTTDYNYLFFSLRGGAQSALMNREYDGWQTSTSWPPETSDPQTLYLRPEPSGTVASRYDGTLSLEPPSGHMTLPAFRYEPAPVWDPVYSSGGNPWRFYTFPDLRGLDQAGWTFTSPVLASDVSVQGPMRLQLMAETDLYDFDWMVTLSDIWPDGSSHRISSGFLRASLRNSPDLYQPRPEGEQRYNITLASVANVFQAGHRIRLALHQVNSDDAEPTQKETQLHLGKNQAKLELYTVGSSIEFEPFETCLSCDPRDKANETFEQFLEWYITGALVGTDPQSNQEIKIGFWASRDVEQAASGGILVYLPHLAITAVGIDGIAPSLDPLYDYLFVLPNEYRMQVRCSREGEPGTIRITDGTLDVGPLEVTRGMIRCFDVPYANW
jgi:predicted acyl esterase